MSWCSGEMLRYHTEHRLRRQLTKRTTDAEARKRGDQTGLDTLVVHAVNDEYSLLAIYSQRPSESVKYPPGEYAAR
jgi:hypothetical protein